MEERPDPVRADVQGLSLAHLLLLLLLLLAEDSHPDSLALD